MIVKMNGTFAQDVVTFFNSEYEAVRNRCVILKMHCPLRSLYSNKELDELREGSRVLFEILFTTEDFTYNEHDKSLSEYNNFS